jgi:sulfatase maturation enzyme AslB (radical SAM superfamily)
MACPSSPPIKTKTPAYFHVLAKPTGAVCNLDCKYWHQYAVEDSKWKSAATTVGRNEACPCGSEAEG